MGGIALTVVRRPHRPRELFLAAIASWAHSLDASRGVEQAGSGTRTATVRREGLRDVREFLRRAREEGFQVQLPELTDEESRRSG